MACSVFFFFVFFLQQQVHTKAAASHMGTPLQWETAQQILCVERMREQKRRNSASLCFFPLLFNQYTCHRMYHMLWHHNGADANGQVCTFSNVPWDYGRFSPRCKQPGRGARSHTKRFNSELMRPNTCNLSRLWFCSNGLSCVKNALPDGKTVYLAAITALETHMQIITTTKHRYTPSAPWAQQSV